MHLAPASRAAAAHPVDRPRGAPLPAGAAPAGASALCRLSSGRRTQYPPAQLPPVAPLSAGAARPVDRPRSPAVQLRPAPPLSADSAPAGAPSTRRHSSLRWPGSPPLRPAPLFIAVVGPAGGPGPRCISGRRHPIDLGSDD
ncbi:unnamed protein product [Urochloa humidicola]